MLSIKETELQSKCIGHRIIRVKRRTTVGGASCTIIIITVTFSGRNFAPQKRQKNRSKKILKRPVLLKIVLRYQISENF